MLFYKKRNYILSLLVISMFQFLLSILFICYVNYQYIGAVYFVISSMFFILVVFKLIAINMQSELKALEQYLKNRIRFLESETGQKRLDKNRLHYSYDYLNDILSDVYKQQSKMQSNPFYIVRNNDIYVRYKIIQRICSYSAIFDDQVFDFNSMYKSKCQRGDV